MSIRYSIFILTMAYFATGCAFFDEPVSDDTNGELIPSDVSTIDTPPEAAPGAPAPESGNTESISSSTVNQETEKSASYLVVAPIDGFPRGAQNVAVVHLTERRTSRELSLCKALMQNMPTVNVEDLPPDPLTVVVWPVPNDNAGANCIEMISDFEPIEITTAAEGRIDEKAAGPFLLTRNLPSGKRMVFDVSFMSNSALSSTVNQWLSLLGSSPADWPEYRRAR